MKDKTMKILSIETSCDDTGIAVLEIKESKNSPKFEEYPKFEKLLAKIINEKIVKTLVLNKQIRKSTATLAWIFSPLLP